MSVYTKNGDNGRTGLLNGQSVLKTDDRIELLGTIDELNSHIGMAKVLADEELRLQLVHIQRTLMFMMSGVAAPMKREYRFDAVEVQRLEGWIDHMEDSFPRPQEFVLYGGCEESARLDVARAVARRAERRFRTVAQKFVADKAAMQYMNRLSDYLYVCARYADYKAENIREEGIRQEVIRDVLKDAGRRE
ncbi:MAG: cob(I)yrinic acid a,c-diamide adenosyltransferase [Eubacteriales bacterium]|nr:cob(I)yrinic acid a,c-diamide adenosyltransferase [Eubacteriales bacterium]